MHGEIITIGNELISGRTLDLNAWYAAGRLTAEGFKVTRITTVGDHHERAIKVLKEAVGVSEYIIVTGGLGSTEDDITNEIVAKTLNRPLHLNEEMLALIKGFVEKRELEMSPSLEKMAWIPQGSEILNPEGNACGFSISEGAVQLYCLPGVPDQMRYLMDEEVIPAMLARYRTMQVIRQRVLKLFGLSEPDLAEALKALPTRDHPVRLGFYPHFPENHITLGLRGPDETTVIRELDDMERDIRNLVGDYIFATGSRTMEEVVGALLGEKDLTLGTAESCTGGLIGNLVTDVPGSSTYFRGGVVVYDNRAKSDLLGVLPETLETCGAVSNEAVGEMASGVRERLMADIGVAVSGIAGPAGGTEEKPVGTVYIGLASKNETITRGYRFWGDRGQIKRHSAIMALDWVRRYIHGNPFLPGI